MSRRKGFTTCIDIVRSSPFVATFTFETDYSHSMFRVSRDAKSGKYWVQGGALPSLVVDKIADIDPAPITSVICEQAHRDRAERLGGYGVVIGACPGDDTLYIEEAFGLTPGELCMFARHVLEEFDKRSVPWSDDVAAAVADGLRQMGEAA